MARNVVPAALALLFAVAVAAGLTATVAGLLFAWGPRGVVLVAAGTAAVVVVVAVVLRASARRSHQPS